MRASPTHRGVDFLVKVRLLQFEEPAVVLDLGVGAVLDVHRRLLALRLSDTGVSVGLQVSPRQSPSLQTDSALT